MLTDVRTRFEGHSCTHEARAKKSKKKQNVSVYLHLTGRGQMKLGFSERARREAFIPTPFLGTLLNPVYIARSALYRCVAAVAPEISGSVLDFGCGSKPYEFLFKNATEYVGLDTKAGHDHEALGSKVDVFYDGKVIPFEAGRFDAVVSFEVMEHVFNIDEALEEIKRVLKPGGTVLITMPFLWFEHEQPYDFGRYTSYGIKSVLLRHGFSNPKVRKTTSFFLALCQLNIAYLAYFLFPTSPLARRALQVLVIFPATVFSVALDRIIPKRDECFCASLVTATKAGDNNLTPN